MATKREAPEDSTARQPWKRPRPHHPERPNHGKKSFKKAHPVNELKSTIRSLRRLLSTQDDLPGSVRMEKERALQTAQRNLVAEQRAKRRSDMIGKYHKIRFFDRQKAERRLRRARKESEGAEAVEEREVEVCYAIYFPLDRDYVPLFPAKRKSKGEEEGGEGKVLRRQGDEEMWEVVKKCMKEGTLKDLREGRLLGDDMAEEVEAVVRPVERKTKPQPQTKGKTENEEGGNRRARRAEKKLQKKSDESGDEDGVGFFE